MQRIRRTGSWAAAAALLLASCEARGPQPQIGVEDAWARATAPGQKSAAAYFTITNRGGEDRLVSVSTAIGKASVHSTSMHGGIMRMRPVEALQVPANSTVALTPGATHVMISSLNQPLEVGQGIPLELDFKRSGKRRVTARVRPAGTDGARK